MSRVILGVPTELTVTGKLERKFVAFCRDNIGEASMTALTGESYGVVWYNTSGKWELLYINASADGRTFSPTRCETGTLNRGLFATMPHELYLLVSPDIGDQVKGLLEKDHSVKVVHIPGSISTS